MIIIGFVLHTIIFTFQYSVLWIIIYFVYFLLVIVLFVFHIMASDYPLGIFKLCSNLRIAVRFDIMQCYMSE
jgi:hypothetical protein